ncbi:hypothetical protein BN946_scf184979.g71 [Trametes cinnabarina]|uniref:Uncharacterized protein n=1 Tax=Pycnoporus cinnabarinus TaxID=5643 RepID=A0A060SJZ4_PYCCI|nr:hypothetical protein BN946_scf184979.g71 [Trametes cinnabarina]
MMSLGASSHFSSSSLAAISLAAQSAALVSDALDFCALSTASYPVSMETFTDCIFAQPLVKRALSIVAFETLKDISPLSATVRATLGLLGHQYNLATILLDDGRKTHIRVDYFAIPLPNTSSRLSLHIDDDYKRLTRDSKLLSRLATTGLAPTFLTLGGLSALFRVAQQKAAHCPYDVFSRNCFWMTDSLFYSVAKRDTRVWLAPGMELTPRGPLERFLRGEDGVVDAAVACGTPNEAARFWARSTAHVVRSIHMFFNRGGAHQSRGHDQELDEWIAQWKRHSERDIRQGDLDEVCRAQ